MTPLALLAQCAPLIAPVTMAAIVQHESAGNPLAIHDNTAGVSLTARSREHAVRLARERIAAGHSVDLGLGQINSRNLSGLKTSIQAMFEPCENLSASQAILLAGWKRASGDLIGALSAYATGKINSPAGARYAAQVYALAGTKTEVLPQVIVPAIPGATHMPAWTRQGELGEHASATMKGAGTKEAKMKESDAVAVNNTNLPPVRPIFSWTPDASPLRPQAGGLSPSDLARDRDKP